MNHNYGKFYDEVAFAMYDAKLVAWDGCHKVYVAMDETQASWFRENYDYTVIDTPDIMFQTVVGWYENSCALKFVQSVETNEEDPNYGFRDLIAQGDYPGMDEEEEEDEWEDEYEEEDEEEEEYARA